MKIAPESVAVALLSLSLVGCGGVRQSASNVRAEAENAVSPIVGRWRINGDEPAPQPSLPQFVSLDFETDGTLDASYVAAGGALAGIVKTDPKVKSERDSYALSGSNGLRIVEGSRALSFTYEVRAGKLFLTPPGESQAIDCAKSAGS
jgi:hypothetical protein